MENTRFYHEWAAGHRHFLYNDKAVAADPVLGRLKASLPQSEDNHLSLVGGLFVDLKDLIASNPANRTPLEYLGAFYLLNKNLPAFGEMVDRYWGTEALPVLPASFQEAIIILNEKDPEAWRNYRIPETTVRRFAEYKKQVLAHAGNQAALPGLLRNSYGNTYWYYFMFK